jgi:hypothetical protein
MSTRRLLARLDRLEKMPKPVPGAFRIDPALAKALRDDQRRFDELWKARYDQNSLNETSGDGGHQIAPSEEEALLRARIDRMVDTIVCPPSYGAWQARKDKFLTNSRLIESRSAAEDAEQAQLTARVLAFSRTPEGRGRDRIAKLRGKRLESLEIFRNGLRAADQSELDHLLVLYPDLPLDPDNPLHQMLIKMKEHEAKKRALEKEAQKHAQEDEPDYDL